MTTRPPVSDVAEGPNGARGTDPRGWGRVLAGLGVCGLGTVAAGAYLVGGPLASAHGGDVAALMVTHIAARVDGHVRASGALPRSLDDVFDGEAVPVDPWGRPFAYVPSRDGSYEVVSLGGDGRLGGRGLDADIALSALVR